MRERITRLLAGFALVILFPLTLAAASENGGYAGSHWQVPLGARPAAMGGAYTSLSDDAAGAFYNPAGLSHVSRPLLGLSYRAMQLDRTLGYLHGLFPVRNQAVLGVGWLYAQSGTVDARDNDGDLLGFDLAMNDHDFFITFAKRFEQYLSLGARFSYLYSRFDELSASAVGFDFGAIVYLDQFVDRERREELPVKDVRIGAVIRRIEAHYLWNNEKYLRKYVGDGIAAERDDDVPLEFALGGSARFIQQKLVTSADIVVKDKIGSRFHGGAEFFVTPQFALRGGYSDGSFTTGTGYILKAGKRNIAIDYAFSAERVDEGAEHLFSIDVLF